MKHSRALTRAGAVLLALLGCQATPAVEVDPGGSGQVLLLPLWTTTGGHSTLLNIQNVHETANSKKIAKLRLRDPEGAVVFSGNLYFHHAQDAWTAGIGPRPGGGSRLFSSDETCLLVDDPLGEVQPFSGTIDLDADYGSAEVILMGSGWTVPADQQSSVQWDDVCSQLAAKWNDGEWSEGVENPNPPGMHDAYQLFAEWLIVQAESGVLYKVPGVALDGYSDRVQHTPPGDPLPNLASGHGAETDQGINRSRLCSNGVCREDNWPTPLDAMAAALMVDHFRGSFNINPAAGASTDLVIYYPLVKYFAERDGIEHPLGHSAVQMDTHDRAGNARMLVTCVSIAGFPCYDSYWVAPVTYAEDSSSELVLKSDAIVAISFNPADELIAPSALLALPNAYRIEVPPYTTPDNRVITLPPMPDEGSFSAHPNELPLNLGYTMQADDGFLYRSSPAIPVIFQRYINGVLQGSDGVPQRANYGTAFSPAKWAWPITWPDIGED